MKIHHTHPWNCNIQEAKRIQVRFQSLLNLNHNINFNSIKQIAAADISYSLKSSKLYAAVVICNFPELAVQSTYTTEYVTDFSYIPGYLSFREIPPLISIFKSMQDGFDVLLCDGQGIAHPRKFGLASHLGVLLEKPSIGCAKSRLIGDFSEPSAEKGFFSILYDRAEQIGIVLRTRTNVKPLFVSPGHMVNFDDCRSIVLACLRDTRIPQPLKFAHQAVNNIRISLSDI
jgi:deoxyribonuclease V